MSWLARNQKHPSFLKPHGIPLRYSSFLLEDVQNAAIRRACEEYLGSVDRHATKGVAPAFFGRGGTYKTLGAAALARNIFETLRVQVAFFSASAELGRLERSRFADETDRRFNWLAGVAFLVVDDFDAALPESWQAERLIELAEARYSNLLPTLWTCNLAVTKTDQSALVNRYGQAFARRVWEGSEGFRVVAK